MPKITALLRSIQPTLHLPNSSSMDTHRQEGLPLEALVST